MPITIEMIREHLRQTNQERVIDAARPLNSKEGRSALEQLAALIDELKLNFKIVEWARAEGDSQPGLVEALTQLQVIAIAGLPATLGDLPEDSQITVGQYGQPREREGFFLSEESIEADILIRIPWKGPWNAEPTERSLTKRTFAIDKEGSALLVDS